MKISFTTIKFLCDLVEGWIIKLSCVCTASCAPKHVFKLQKGPVMTILINNLLEVEMKGSIGLC